MRSLGFLALFLLAGCAGRASVAGQAPGRLAAGSHEFRLVHAGIQRSYRLHVPRGAGAGPLPVLVAFHGGGGNAAQFERTSGLPDLAERERFLVVFPEGTGRLGLHTWNAGGCCGGAMDRAVDDVGFTAAVLDDLGRRTGVDPRRVYVTGHSNGGMMSYRVAAELGDRIAAVAPVAGAMHLAPFRPVRPVPVLHIHSVDDPRALYQGGEGPPFPGTTRTVRHRPVEEGLEAWRSLNGCGGSPRVAERREGVAGGRDAGQAAELLVWDGCTTGAAVHHWRLSGSGHGWPGQTRALLRESLVGPSTTLVDAATEVWRFVRDHRLP